MQNSISRLCASFFLTAAILLGVCPISRAVPRSTAVTPFIAMTIASSVINGWNYPGTVVLRVYADQDFLTSSGEFIKQGSPGGAQFYRQYTCSLVGTTLTIPAIDIVTTTDSPDVPSATLTFSFFVNGTKRGDWLTGVKIPHTVSNPTTVAIIRNYNNPPGPQPGTYGISFDQAAQMIAQTGGVTPLRTINTTSPITGGGNLSADRTIACPTCATGISVTGTPSVGQVPTATSGTTATWQSPSSGATFRSSDYASLNAAVAAIGSTPGILLIKTASYPSGASCTVPSTLVIDWGDVGSLLAANSQTIAVNSDSSHWPVRNLFLNTTLSHGTMSFSGNALIAAYYPQWWGVVGDNATDDTAALQAFTDQIPSTSAHSVFTRGLIIRITSTWKIWGKYSWLMESATVLGNGSSQARQVPTIMWAGADGGTVIDISKTRDSTFRGLYVDMNGKAGADSTTGADRGIWLNQETSNVGDICTSNIFEYVDLNANSQRSNITVVDIGDVTNSNVEFMQFNYCVFSGNTAPHVSNGVYGASRLVYMHTQNTLAHKFRKTTWNRAHIGIDVQYGSFSEEGGEGGAMDIAYRIGNLIGASRISDDRLEETRQVISTVGSGGSDMGLTCIANDWPALGVVGAGTATYPFIDWSLAGGVPLILIGNTRIGDFRGFLPGGIPVNNSLVTDVFKGRGSSGNELTAIGNITQGVDAQVLLKNYGTFYRATVDGRVFSGNATEAGQVWANAIDFVTSTGIQRSGLGQASVGFDRRRLVAGDNLFLSDGVVEFFEVPSPNPPSIKIVGTYGLTLYGFALVAYDGGGNRTPRSEIYVTGVANATLSGSNYIQLDWADIPGAAGGVDIINTVDNGTTFQLVAHVASGVVTYNVVANPGGAFTYALPTYNETARIGLRGPIHPINAITFTDGATTPSVKQSNLFITGNTAPTSITNFTQGTDNQTITIQCTEANTTLVNGGTIKLAGGVNFVCSADDLITLVLRSGVWREQGRSVN